MEPVVDHLNRDARVFNSRRDGPGIAVMDAIHGIKDMGHNACTSIECSLSCFIIGITVPYSRDHTGPGKLPDSTDAVREFGSYGDLAHTAAGTFQQTVNKLRYRVFKALRVVGPFACKSEERTLKMRAQDIRAGRHYPPDCPHIPAHHIYRVCDQRKYLAGSPMHHMPRSCQRNRFSTIIICVCPRSMRMDIYISGGKRASCGINNSHTGIVPICIFS